MTRVAERWDVATVAVAKAALSLAVLRAGFAALSDDDYSRIVIAETFAHAPSLDPSGTSWLPLPFYVHGAAMMLLGRSLATAHATAVLLGVSSALCIHRAARWLGVSRGGAVLSALVASSLLTAARLGVSAQPEALVTGLVMLGAASTHLVGARRVAGAAALGAACLCRYEAWAAAFVFALLAVYDAARGPVEHSDGLARSVARGAEWSRPTLFAAAALAVVAPVAWVVHGVTAHGDALFFLHRVAAYRRALGATETLGRSMLAYPAALFRSEPEVTLAALLVLRIGADRAPRTLRRLARPALVVGGIFVFLIVGRALDGAPTHHAERTLLPVWTLFTIMVCAGLVLTLSPFPGRARGDAIARMAPLLMADVLVSIALRMGRPREPDASREPEQSIGLSARARAAPDERLLVDTADYGYFAVIAAFGAPERAEAVDRHDPRDAVSADVFASREQLITRLRVARATWLVTREAHLPVAAGLGTVQASSGPFHLLRIALP